jgi:hypothetical protein
MTHRIFYRECVFGELLQGIKNKYEEEIIINYWKYLPKKEYKDIIIEAGNYSSKNKLLDKGVGLLGAIILLHGIKSGSKIWTIDKKFQEIMPEELKYTGNEKGGVQYGRNLEGTPYPSFWGGGQVGPADPGFNL